MLRRICFYPVIGFESGFTGFRGFFSFWRWYWDDACRSIKLMTIFAYSFRRCDHRSGEIFSRDSFPITTILNQRRHL